MSKLTLNYCFLIILGWSEYNSRKTISVYRSKSSFFRSWQKVTSFRGTPFEQNSTQPSRPSSQPDGRQPGTIDGALVVPGRQFRNPWTTKEPEQSEMEPGRYKQPKNVGWLYEPKVHSTKLQYLHSLTQSASKAIQSDCIWVVRCTIFNGTEFETKTLLFILKVLWCSNNLMQKMTSITPSIY